MTNTEMLELRDCGPARNLPNGMWMNVLKVLQFHGLDVRPADVVTALLPVIDKTPVEKGGRLLPDGSIDRSDLEETR